MQHSMCQQVADSDKHIPHACTKPAHLSTTCTTYDNIWKYSRRLCG